MTTRDDIIERLARMIARRSGWSDRWDRIPDGIRDLWRADAEEILNHAPRAGLRITLAQSKGWKKVKRGK